jgi:dTDP-4-amino-4,6-dideoxygalactose transaminase
MLGHLGPDGGIAQPQDPQSGRSEVVAPAYTCPLVALAIAQCGLQLRLCDLRADALDMDPVCLQRLCSDRTLAVLPTHLCGRVADVDAALQCARAVGAYVIEDAAQALGRAAAQLRWASRAISAFSAWPSARG